MASKPYGGLRGSFRLPVIGSDLPFVLLDGFVGFDFPLPQFLVISFADIRCDLSNQMSVFGEQLRYGGKKKDLAWKMIRKAST